MYFLLDNDLIFFLCRLTICLFKKYLKELSTFICDQDKDETETVKRMQTSEMYDGDGPKHVRSEVSDQEEDEESEKCPVSISKCKGSY